MYPAGTESWISGVDVDVHDPARHPDDKEDPKLGGGGLPDQGDEGEEGLYHEARVDRELSRATARRESAGYDIADHGAEAECGPEISVPGGPQAEIVRGEEWQGHQDGADEEVEDRIHDDEGEEAPLALEVTEALDELEAEAVPGMQQFAFGLSFGLGTAPLARRYANEELDNTRVEVGRGVHEHEEGRAEDRIQEPRTALRAEDREL